MSLMQQGHLPGLIKAHYDGVAHSATASLHQNSLMNTSSSRQWFSSCTPSQTNNTPCLHTTMLHHTTSKQHHHLAAHRTLTAENDAQARCEAPSWAELCACARGTVCYAGWRRAAARLCNASQSSVAHNRQTHPNELPTPHKTAITTMTHCTRLGRRHGEMANIDTSSIRLRSSRCALPTELPSATKAR